MRASRVIALAALGAAGGYLLGAVRTAPAALPAITIARSPAAPPAREIIERQVCPAVGADEIRQIVREELAQRPGPVAAAATPAGEAMAEDPSAADRAQAIVDASLVAGVWTEGDRTSLRAAMGALSEPQAAQILGALFPALNTGRLRLAYDGTPL